MPFIGKDWRNAASATGGGDVSTPVSADALEDLETRVTDYTDLRVGQGSYNLKDFDAAGSGSGDDTAEIIAAIAATAATGGVLDAPQGVYPISDPITIPPGVVLRGAGSPWGGGFGTVFKCLTSDAQLKFTGSTAVHQGFLVDGNAVAANPFRVDLSFGLTFIGVTASSAAQDNIVIYDAQQPTFYSCNAAGAARDQWVIDGSTESGLFSRCEAAQTGVAGRHCLYVGDDGGVFGFGQFFNQFDQCLFEQFGMGGSAGGAEVARIERSGGGVGSLLFHSCGFVATNSTAAQVVLVDESTAGGAQRIHLDNCMIQNNDTPNMLGLKVDVSATDFGVLLSGQTSILGALSAGVKATVADTLVLDGELQTLSTPAVPFVDPTSAAVRLDGNIRANSTDAAFVPFANVAGGSLHGARRWYRNSATIVGTVDNIIGGGYLSIVGYLETQHAINQLATNGTGYFQQVEQATPPGAPAANKAIIYTRDDGAGRTQMVAGFPTGAVQPIATENGSAITLNSQTANYTLVAADSNALIKMDSTSARTVTIPPNASVAFPIGVTVAVEREGTGTVTLVAGAGVTLNTPGGLAITARYGTATVVKMATNTWIVSGLV